MKAAGYIRESTDQQASEGYGMAAQEHSIRSYCDIHGWELIEVYVDAGRSGSSMRGRDDLARLLAEARSGRFERVVFWKLDRLGRNLKDLLEICDQLEGAGVGIVSIQEAIDTGTAAGRMVRSFLGAVAEFEREIIVELIKAGLEQKARQGELLGNLPLGYLRGENGAIEADPVVAPIVREAFQKYATGKHSLRQLAQWAERVGLLSAEGNRLDRDAVRKLLCNISYTGQVAYKRRHGGGVIAEGNHPAIVDTELFETVQKTLISRRRRPSPRPFGREPYPLSGVSFCAADDAPLVGVKAGRKGSRYMRCSTAHRLGRGACTQRMVSAELLEGQVAIYLTDMTLPEEYVEEVIAELERRRGTGVSRIQVERLKREMDRWHRLFVLAEIDEARLKRETAPLKRALAEIDRPHTIHLQDAVQHLGDIGRLFSSSSRSLQRQFAREVFDRIVVEDRQVTSMTPALAYAPFFLLDRRQRFAGEMGVVWRPRQDSNLQPSA